MLDLDDYKPKCKIPKPVAPICDNCGKRHDVYDVYCSKCGVNVQMTYQTKINLRKDAVKKYHEEVSMLNNLFRKHALDYVGLSNHPKKNIIFDKAYMDGHSAGYPEVLSKLEDLAVFIEDLER